ncbi:toll-like receptor 7 [Zophobas morio]|uniref:toll-like receptor 7 n=1 Tax=Zophobas morio TaxID=2755281 RepID=UPI0030837148
MATFCEICVLLFAIFAISGANPCDKYENDIIVYKTTDLTIDHHRIHYSDKISTDEEVLNILIFDQYIPKLCCNLFQLAHKVVFLLIKNCNVKELQPNCYENEFRYITTDIDFSFNQIEVINKGTFKKLQVLQIQLQSNLIKMIEDEAFLNLPNLTLINLSNNRLFRLNPHAFLDVPVLDTLYFSCNNVELLENGNFNFLGEQHAYIHLSSNNIFLIESRVFQREVPGSLSVDLSYNAIESIPANLFDNHVFRVIDLGCNPTENLSGIANACDKYENDIITYKIYDLVLDRYIIYMSDTITTEHEALDVEISNQYIPKACCNLFELTHKAYIDLSNNNISFLDSGVFERTAAGTLSVDLSANALESVPENVFDNYIFEHIDLGCNPIVELSRLYENNSSISYVYVNTTFLDRVNFENFVTWANSRNIKLEESSCVGKREAYIHLFNNNISFIESRAFQRKVEGSLSIDLSNNAIESMPANLFANHIFIIIDLGCNPIEDLSGMCENNCSISSNAIESMAAHFFDNQLFGYIDCGCNPIEDLARMEVTTKIKTTFMEIIDEDIPKLCCNLFHLAHEVAHLTISNSNVKELQENCYENAFKNVSFEIVISFNQISFINKGTFNKLRVVQIDLQSNIIKVIENEAFVNLPNLMLLNLSNNQLQRLNPQAFIEVPVLNTLFLQCKQNASINLRKNSISLVDSNAFERKFAGPLSLDLSGDAIKSLPKNLLDHCTLKDIDLTCNPLENLMYHVTKNQVSTE